MPSGDCRGNKVSKKFSVKDISGTFDGDNEGTVCDDRGQLVQIVDGPSFSHLVYLDLRVKNPPVYRGSHYHNRKKEIFYVIEGSIDVDLYDLDTGAFDVIALSGGEKLTLLPRLAHRFLARQFSRIIEISPLPYDRMDVFPFDFGKLA